MIKVFRTVVKTDRTHKLFSKDISHLLSIAFLHSPVKILSFDMLRQPVITAKFRQLLVFNADSKSERIKLTILS